MNFNGHLVYSLMDGFIIGLIVKQARVLIVDDIKDNRRVLEYMLDDMHICWDSADSGQQALDYVGSENYAVILMDANMPEMSGFQCVEKIHANPDTAHTPIIFITAVFTGPESIGKGYNCGAVDYIVKPIDRSVLESKVRVFVDLYLQKNKVESTLSEVLEERRLKDKMLKNIGEGVLGLTADNVINFANAAACSVLKKTSVELVGMALKKLMAPKLSPAQWLEFSLKLVDDSLEQEHIDERLFWRNAEDSFVVQYSYVPLLENNCFTGAVLSFQEITKRKEAEQALVTRALYDDVTGLPNRSYFWDLLQRLLAMAARSSDQITLLMIDLDDFKKINELHGRATGDLILSAVSRMLETAVRKSDVLARVGGDEFCLIVTDYNDAEVGATIANKILHKLGVHFELTGESIPISASIGIATYPQDGRSAPELMQAADEAMFCVKNSKRNSYMYYSKELHDVAAEDMLLCSELRLAIERDELSIHYQPQISLEDNKVVGVEALVRWLHPNQGFISPERFIPIAETHGLIESLGRWIFQQVMDQAVLWQPLIEAKLLATIAINASAVQLNNKNFAADFIKMMQDKNLSSGLIELELTESAVMADPENAIIELNKLHQHGVKISVDDFGTGYSSLSYLTKLPIDVLKIDRSFVRALGSGKNDKDVVKTIVQLAHNLGLKVIAEGIETQEQLTILKDFGCDLAQGYFFAKPLSAPETAEMLKAGLH